MRGQKVMLDRDLSELYGVATKVLKQAVRRNSKRFPEDSMFELSGEEFKNWRSLFVTPNGAKIRPTVPGGFRCFKMSGNMKIKDREPAIEIIRRMGIVRPADLEIFGITRARLYSLVQKGLVERRGRGIYVARKKGDAGKKIS